MPMTDNELRDAIEGEIGETSPAWLGKIPFGAANRVITKSSKFVADATEKAEIQRLGAAYGCHTCNKEIKDTPQVYILDHIPPRAIFGDRGRYRHFPHCDLCAGEQAALVRQNGMIYKPLILKATKGFATQAGLRAAAQKLRDGGADARTIKQLTGGTFSHSRAGKYHYGAPEMMAVQKLGRRNGCHVCGTKQPVNIYHADHNPPRAIAMTSWFPKTAQAALGVDVYERDVGGNPVFFFRPQCPDCSHAQGVRCNAIVRELETRRDAVGVMRYDV